MKEQHITSFPHVFSGNPYESSRSGGIRSWKTDIIKRNNPEGARIMKEEKVTVIYGFPPKTSAGMTAG